MCSMDIVGTEQADYGNTQSSETEFERKADEESEARHMHEDESTKSFEVHISEIDISGVKSGVVLDFLKVQVAVQDEIESSQEDRSGSCTFYGNSFVTVTDQNMTEGGIPLRKERELDPLVMEPPRTVEGIELVIRGDSKTVVDWINGKAKQKVSSRAFEIIQIQRMEWWKKGVDLCHGIGDWAVHIFREHNKEAEIDWTKVTGICGFWDGSCNDKVCGAGITISFFIQGLV